MIKEMLLRIAITSTIANGITATKSYGEIHQFLLDNGQRRVEIVSNSSSSVWNTSYMRAIYCARIRIGVKEMTDSKSFAVFLFDPDTDDIKRYIGIISQRIVRTSLLVITKPWEDKDGDLFSIQMQEMGFFYVAMANGSEISSWHYVLSLKSGSVRNRLTFAKPSFRIIETFDLQGLQITSTSLTHAPYLTIEDCNDSGLDCNKNHGYLIDYMNILATKFNFTYKSHRDLDNDWGVTPKAGPFNTSGTWGGVMGDVINGKYDMTISIFQWTTSRNELLEFAPVAKFRLALAVTPKHSETDFGLFTRGFTIESWIAIFFLATLAVFCILLANLLNADENRNGLKILAFTFWIFFVVINAYYGGVLTMFFTTPFSVPFETEREVIREYPTWKLVFHRAWNAYFHNFVRQGDPDYISLWQRYENDPAETTFKTIEEGLDRAERGQNIIFFNEQQLQGSGVIIPFFAGIGITNHLDSKSGFGSSSGTMTPL